MSVRSSSFFAVRFRRGRTSYPRCFVSVPVKFDKRSSARNLARRRAVEVLRAQPKKREKPDVFLTVLPAAKDLSRKEFAAEIIKTISKE